MNIKNKIIIIFIFLTVLGQQITNTQAIIVQPNQNNITPIWNEAKNKIIEAYNKIIVTENSGVNSTVISKLLNESIYFYDKGIKENNTDPIMAVQSFNQSIQISNNIIEYNLNNEINQSIYAKNQLIFMTILSSIIIIIIILLIWIIFKNYYNQNELNKKIEVN
jgi:hypothetical protein